MTHSWRFVRQDWFKTLETFHLLENRFLVLLLHRWMELCCYPYSVNIVNPWKWIRQYLRKHGWDYLHIFFGFLLSIQPGVHILLMTTGFFADWMIFVSSWTIWWRDFVNNHFRHDITKKMFFSVFTLPCITLNALGWSMMNARVDVRWRIGPITEHYLLCVCVCVCLRCSRRTTKWPLSSISMDSLNNPIDWLLIIDRSSKSISSHWLSTTAARHKENVVDLHGISMCIYNY